MAAETPQARVADPTLVHRIALEGSQLGVSQRLAGEGEKPQDGARDLQRMQNGDGIGHRQQERHAQQRDGSRLQLEKPEHLGAEVARPILPQLHIAAVFDRMMPGDAAQQVRAQSQAPQDRHGGQNHPSRQPAGTAQRIETGQECKGIGPGHVHKPVVVQPAAQQKQPGKGNAEPGESSDEEQQGGHGRDYARTADLDASRRSAGRVR